MTQKKIKNTLKKQNLLKKNPLKETNFQKSDFVLKAKLFAKTKPYFVIALIFSLIIIILFIYSNVQESVSQEEALGAREIYDQLNLNLDEYLRGIEAQIKEPVESTLDDDYLYSIRDDLVWLKAKNESIFYSKPNSEVFAKETALYSSVGLIIQLNLEFSIEIGSPDQQEKINLALKTDVNTPILFNDDELIELFENNNDRQAFLRATKEIFNEYVNSKKMLIQNSTSKERQYVEAKKIILLTYSNNVIKDVNYI